jgi:hypothetical protein
MNVVTAVPKPRPTYEPPRLIRFSARSVGAGQCTAGNGDGTECLAGSSAVIYCHTGSTAGTCSSGSLG